MVVSFCGKRIILSKNSLLKIPKRNGYIVLVPEIGEDLPHKNPLLRGDKTPEFTNITIEKCIAAIGKQTLDIEEGIRNLEANLSNTKDVNIFRDVLDPIEEMHMALQITWGIAKTLYFGNQSLMPTKHYVHMHERAKRALASKYLSQPIYEACKNIINDKDAELTDQQKRVLSKIILEGRLNGLDLNEKDRDKYVYHSNLIYNKANEIKEKVEASDKHLSQTIKDHEVVKDFPEEYLKMIAADPNKPFEGPWTVTLKHSVVQPFMEYCPDRKLRWKVWDANVTKASLYQERLLQTSVALEELRGDRQSKAKILGFKTYADLSMETKMAESVEHVYSVMDTLLETARPAQEREIKLLKEFANERGMDGNINLWDVPYWRRKQRRTLYNYNEEMLRDYFPLPKVLSGFYDLVESLFNVKIVECKKPDTWHQDVRYFEIYDLKKSSDEPVANFYLDPYARTDDKLRTEQHSGWMIPIKDRSKVCGTLPLVSLIFNFQPPVLDRPSLLSFNDVQVLFQKLGRMLQQTLTTVDYAEISGFSYVDWDAVFIPDYFMTNWLYEASVLRQISGHYDTGESLSNEMIETLKNARSHLAGYDMCKELYLSRLDLELHSSEQFWVAIMDKLWKKYLVIPQQKRDCHICSFTDIFSGDWGAAYYSFLWSEMIAADLYSAFQEISPENEQQRKEIGNRYHDTFLSLGGSCPTSEIFRRFRGRDPSPKALLASLGLVEHSSDETN